jgi:hypothetical protein
MRGDNLIKNSFGRKKTYLLEKKQYRYKILYKQIIFLTIFFADPSLKSFRERSPERRLRGGFSKSSFKERSGEIPLSGKCGYPERIPCLKRSAPLADLLRHLKRRRA